MVLPLLVLQGGDPKYREAWTRICDVSRQEFQQIYDRLKVTLEEKVSVSLLSR